MNPINTPAGWVPGMVDLVELPLWVGVLMQPNTHAAPHTGPVVATFLLAMVMTNDVFVAPIRRWPRWISANGCVGLPVLGSPEASCSRSVSAA